MSLSTRQDVAPPILVAAPVTAHANSYAVYDVSPHGGSRKTDLSLLTNPKTISQLTYKITGQNGMSYIYRLETEAFMAPKGRASKMEKQFFCSSAELSVITP